MTISNTRKNLTIAGIVTTAILALSAIGVNCMNAELASKVDKELYRSEQTSLKETINRIDDKISDMDKEQRKQGHIQARIAAKLNVEVE